MAWMKQWINEWSNLLLKINRLKLAIEINTGHLFTYVAYKDNKNKDDDKYDNNINNIYNIYWSHSLLMQQQ